MRANTLLLLLCLACLPARAADLLPYSLHYQTSAKGMTIDSWRQLEALSPASAGKTQAFRLTQTSSALLMKTEETSEFSISSKGRLIPRSYNYLRKVLGSNRSRRIDFAMAKHQATYSEKGKPAITLKIPDDVDDIYSYQEKLRLELLASKGTFKERTFTVVDNDRVRLFRFRAAGTEWVSTPLGDFKALRIERVRTNSERQTTTWLAIDWDYVVVKMSHHEAGEPDYVLNLIEGSSGGKTLAGQHDKAYSRPADHAGSRR